jgi:hypothetical protein
MQRNMVHNAYMTGEADGVARMPGVCAAIADALGGQPPPRGSGKRLAELLDRDPSVVSRWISGKSVPDAASWGQIEDVLGMTPGTLSRAARSEATDPMLFEQMARMEEQLAELVEAVNRLDRRIDAIDQDRP